MFQKSQFIWKQRSVGSFAGKWLEKAGWELSFPDQLLQFPLASTFEMRHQCARCLPRVLSLVNFVICQMESCLCGAACPTFPCVSSSPLLVPVGSATVSLHIRHTVLTLSLVSGVQPGTTAYSMFTTPGVWPSRCSLPCDSRLGHRLPLASLSPQTLCKQKLKRCSCLRACSTFSL